MTMGPKVSGGQRELTIEYENLHCKIFIDTQTDLRQLTDELERLLEPKLQRTTLDRSHLELDVSRNRDFMPGIDFNHADNFLYSRFYADFEPGEGAHQAEYIACISHLLEALWAQGVNAVASCEFEDELPRKGGYDYENRLRKSNE